MRVLTIDLTLDEPVLCTQLDGEPNSARTFGFIPGAVLRGALVAAYAAERKLRDGEAIYADLQAKAAFFADSVRYMNAYPLVDNERLHPALRSWFRDKIEHRKHGHDAHIYDRAASIESRANKKVAGDSDVFFAVRGEQVLLHEAHRQIAIHTSRDRNAGRATEDNGAVFRYESLAAGQTLRAYVLVNDAGAVTLRHLLRADGDAGATLFVGGARTAGYGRVSARLIKEGDAAAWRETGTVVHASQHMTLLSDALLRDGNGVYGTGAGALVQALADVTGLSPADFTIEPRFVAERVIGGFNRAWGLPLQQVPAACMGSVYEVKSPVLTIEQIVKIERSGIGERRIDGFGRVAFGLQTPGAKFKSVKLEKRFSTESAVTSTAGKQLAQQMADRMLRQMLDQKVTARALEISDRIRKPTASQLKRLQAVVGDVLSEVVRTGKSGGAERLQNYMKNVEKRDSVRRQFTSGGFTLGKPSWLAGSDDLYSWLTARFCMDDANLLDILSVDEKALPRISNVQAQLTPSVRYEYALRLVHVTLALAAKNRETEDGK